MLESFQAEIGKHILGISKYHANSSTLKLLLQAGTALWDEALEFGVRGTRVMQGLFGTLTTLTFSDRICRHFLMLGYMYSELTADYNHDSVVRWLENKDFNNLI